MVEAKLSHFKSSLAPLGVPLSVDALIEKIQDYTYVSLDSIGCLNVHDDRSPIPNKIQIAYREGRWIRFCKDFSTVEESHKVALITHEIIYAGLEEKSWVTETTGLLFSNDFGAKTDLGMKELREVGSVLAAHVVPSDKQALISQAAQVPTEVPRSDDSLSLCWGPSYHMEESGNVLSRVGGVAIWHSPTCSPGLKRLNRLLFLESEGTKLFFKVGQQKIFLGGIKEDGTPESLCNKEFTALCSLKIDQSKENLIHLEEIAEDMTIEHALISGNLKRLEYFKKQGWVPQNYTVSGILTQISAPALSWLLGEGLNPNQSSNDSYQSSILLQSINAGLDDKATLLVQSGANFYFTVTGPTGSNVCGANYIASRGLNKAAKAVARSTNLKPLSPCIADFFEAAQSKGWTDILEILVKRGVAFIQRSLPESFLEMALKNPSLTIDVLGVLPFCPEATFKVSPLHIAMLSNKGLKVLNAFHQSSPDFNSKAQLVSGTCFGVTHFSAYDLAISSPQDHFNDGNHKDLVTALIQFGFELKSGSLPQLVVAYSATSSYARPLPRIWELNWKREYFSEEQINSAKATFVALGQQVKIGMQAEIKQWLGVE